MTTTCTDNTEFTRKTRSRMGMFAWAKAASATRGQRLQLKGMSETRLEDLGLSVDQARDEANRPFWDVPNYWQR